MVYSQTSGCLSVGIVRMRSKAMEFIFFNGDMKSTVAYRNQPAGRETFSFQEECDYLFRE